MKIRRRIHKDKWNIEIVSPKAMKKLADGSDEVCGLCLAHEKAIYIREDSIEYIVIAHEIFHAYFSYLRLSDTKNINLTDAEEIGAEFFAHEGREMVKKAKAITRDLQKIYLKENEQ